MRHYDNGIVEILEEVLQPVYRFEVEVVGRFVEQKDIWIAEKSLRKKDSYLKSIIDIAHLS